jgi:S1-C subfamily serine protease
MRWLAPVVFVLFSVAEVPAGDLPESFGPPVQDVLAGIGSSPRVARTGVPAMPLLKSPETLNIRQMAARLGALKPDQLPATRGEREVRIYAMASNSVVLILTAEGIGSGSLLRADGTILTNWHVVSSNHEVGIVFKPVVEGRRLTKADVYRGRVIRIDEVADLAIVKSESIPSNARPLPLGSVQEISIGSDVHAIGHPTGESWTYTKGFVSQIRKGYEWATEPGATHRADVIQTQTPINPGNSGGPLLSDQGRLIGVNSFKAEGEGLNFAVSVDEVRRLLAATGDRRLARSVAKTTSPPTISAKCEPRELKQGRNASRDADQVVYELHCDGRPTGVLTVPDDPTKPVTLFIEGKGADDPNILLIDTDRNGKWDFSLYDIDKDGKPDLIGYHRNGELKPYRFEPYVASR